MIDRFSAWLSHLQEAPRERRYRWAVGLTILSMTVLVILWVLYLNASLFATPAVVAENSSGFSFTETIRSGLAFAGGVTLHALSRFGSWISGEKTYTVIP
jgi:cytochrome c-type biogenesis protein CcmE